MYRSYIPYLRGLHQIIKERRGGRDEAGWQIKLTKFEIHELEKDINSNESPGKGKHLAPGCQVNAAFLSL